MKTNEFTYKVMDLNTAQLEIPRESYQRELSPDRVKRIVKDFDERIANEPKVSYRSGHYYVFDGQHTIAARKLRNDNQDLKVRCKVYFGMSEKDEALLFTQQTGASAKLSAGVRIRARIFGGDPEAIQFKDATEAIGLRLDYGQDKGKSGSPVSALPTLLSRSSDRNGIWKCFRSSWMPGAERRILFEEKMFRASPLSWTSIMMNLIRSVW